MAGQTVGQVRKRICELVDLYGTAKALAQEWKVSPSYLSDVVRGKRNPGPPILKPLGLKAETRYVPQFNRRTIQGGQP